MRQHAEFGSMTQLAHDVEAAEVEFGSLTSDIVDVLCCRNDSTIFLVAPYISVHFNH